MTKGNCADLLSDLMTMENSENRIKLQIDDLEYALGLMKKNRYKETKANIMYPFLTEDRIQEASKWLNALKSGTIDGVKVDKRRSYPEKRSYTILNEFLSEYFGIDFKLTKVVNYCYSQAYELFFDYEDQEYYVQVPIVEHVYYDTFEEYGAEAFALKFYRVNGNIHHLIGTTFREKDLQGLLSKGMPN